MPREHLTSSELMAAAESGKLDAAARAHAEGCSRCRARLESARDAYATVGRPLGSPPRASRAATPQYLRAPAARLAAYLADTDERTGHADEDALLALLTDALPPDAASALRAHLEGCPACSRRRDALQRLAPPAAALPQIAERYRDETKAAARASLPRRTRVVARLVEGLRDLALTVIPPPDPWEALGPSFILSANEAPLHHLDRPRFHALKGFLGKPLPEIEAQEADDLVAACSADADIRWAPERGSVTLDAHGHAVRLHGSVTPQGPRLDVETRAGLLVELRTAAGKTYSARTSDDGRATFPLEPGAAILRLGTTPRWEIEILLETL